MSRRALIDTGLTNTGASRPAQTRRPHTRTRPTDTARDRSKHGHPKHDHPEPNNTARDRSKHDHPEPNNTARDRSKHDHPEPNNTARDHSEHDHPEPNNTTRDRYERGRFGANETGRATAVSALALTIVLLAAAAPVSQAAAQAEGRIDLVAQTAFVGDTPATIDLRLSAPADSIVRVQTFAALTSREDVHSSYQGLGDQKPFSDFSCDTDEPNETAPCQLNSSGEILSIEIPDEEIGEILRINQGALPVVITLQDANGDAIDTLVTHLLVLDDQPDHTVHIAFLADLSAPLALQPDQTIALDTEDLFERARRIARLRRVPVTVALQPETLQALALSEPGRLDEFIALLADRPVLNAPWVDLDEDAWRLVGDIELIGDQYSHGAAVITEILGRRPSTIARLDRNTAPQTLALLARNGTESAIIDAPPGTVGLAPVHLDASGGETMKAIAIDNSLRQALSHPDPELAGQRALTELAIEAANASTDSAILIDFDRLDGAALDVLLDGIDARSSLQTSEVARALQVPVARNADGRPLLATFRSAPTPNLSQRSADIGATRGTVAAYAAMIAPERTPITPLETLMRAAAASGLSNQQSAAYTRSVFEEVLTGTADITIEPAERITLTDRQADLRITIRNGQPLPITVELLLSAEKLRFVDGERFTRTLDPGDNEILVRVETLASGDARVTVNVTSPTGQIELTEGVVDIRSTAISGLGLVISIIALVVLGGWWARTILRIRRNRAAAAAAAATAAGTVAATVRHNAPADAADSDSPEVLLDSPHFEEPEPPNRGQRDPDSDQPSPEQPEPDPDTHPHTEQPEPDPDTHPHSGQPDQPQQDQEEL